MRELQNFIKCQDFSIFSTLKNNFSSNYNKRKNKKKEENWYELQCGANFKSGLHNITQSSFFISLFSVNRAHPSLPPCLLLPGRMSQRPCCLGLQSALHYHVKWQGWVPVRFLGAHPQQSEWTKEKQKGGLWFSIFVCVAVIPIY